MLLIPAIDMKDGQCVRLKQGDMDQIHRVREDPAAMARSWVDKGARRVHLVDLNGAFAGKPKNEQAIRAVLKEVGCRGRRAVGRRHPRPGHHRTLSRRRPALRDHRHRGREEPRVPAGRPARPLAATSSLVWTPRTARWPPTAGASSPGHEVIDLGKKFEDYGVESIIYTDIGRDGMLSGINIEATVKLAQSLSIPVIASGGLSNLEDIRKLCGGRGRRCGGRDLWSLDLQRRSGFRRPRRPSPTNSTDDRAGRSSLCTSGCACRDWIAMRCSLPCGDRVLVAEHGGQVLSWVAQGRERLYLSPAGRSGRPCGHPGWHSGLLASVFPARLLAPARLGASGTLELHRGRSGSAGPATGAGASPRRIAASRCWSVGARLQTGNHRGAPTPGRLEVTLAVFNLGQQSLPFTGALHTYLALADAADRDRVGLVRSPLSRQGWDSVTDAPCRVEPCLGLRGEIDRILPCRAGSAGGGRRKPAV